MLKELFSDITAWLTKSTSDGATYLQAIIMIFLLLSAIVLFVNMITEWLRPQIIELTRGIRSDGKTLHIIDRGAGKCRYVVCFNFDGRRWEFGAHCESLKDAVAVYEKRQRALSFVTDKI